MTKRPRLIAVAGAPRLEHRAVGLAGLTGGAKADGPGVPHMNWPTHRDPRETTASNVSRNAYFPPTHPGLGKPWVVTCSAVPTDAQGPTLIPIRKRARRTWMTDFTTTPCIPAVRAPLDVPWPVIEEQDLTGLETHTSGDQVKGLRIRLSGPKIG